MIVCVLGELRGLMLLGLIRNGCGGVNVGVGEDREGLLSGVFGGEVELVVVVCCIGGFNE